MSQDQSEWKRPESDKLPLIEDDDDLVPLLRAATNEQLDPLVEYIIKKGKFTNRLDKTEAYKRYAPNHKMYVDDIAAELQRYGGNTLPNMWRGHGVPYRVICCDVAYQLGASYPEGASVADIELRILVRVIERAWDRMNETERAEFWEFFRGVEGFEDLRKVEDLSLKPPKKIGPILLVLLQAGVNMSGFLAYQLAVIIANIVAKTLLKRGLSLVLNRALTKGLSVLAGPIGWIILATWTAIDMAGPAFRVTIPCVLQVAMIRLAGQQVIYLPDQQPEEQEDSEAFWREFYGPDVWDKGTREAD